MDKVLEQLRLLLVMRFENFLDLFLFPVWLQPLCSYHGPTVYRSLQIIEPPRVFHVPPRKDSGPELSDEGFVCGDPLAVVVLEAPLLGISLVHVVLGGADTPPASFAWLEPNKDLTHQASRSCKSGSQEPSAAFY